MKTYTARVCGCAWSWLKWRRSVEYDSLQLNVNCVTLVACQCPLSSWQSNLTIAINHQETQNHKWTSFILQTTSLQTCYRSYVTVNIWSYFWLLQHIKLSLCAKLDGIDKSSESADSSHNRIELCESQQM